MRVQDFRLFHFHAQARHFLQYGGDARRQLVVLQLLRRLQLQLAAPQLARQGQVVAHLGQMRDGIDFLLTLVLQLLIVRGPGQAFRDLLVQRAQIGHQREQQHLHLLARTGAADADGACRHGAAFGQLDDDLVGDDLAIAGMLDHHARAGDDAAFRALHVDFAAQRLQHGTGSDALDAHVAVLVEGRAAHQVAP